MLAVRNTFRETRLQSLHFVLSFFQKKLKNSSSKLKLAACIHYYINLQNTSFTINQRLYYVTLESVGFKARMTQSLKPKFHPTCVEELCEALAEGGGEVFVSVSTRLGVSRILLVPL